MIDCTYDELLSNSFTRIHANSWSMQREFGRSGRLKSEQHLLEVHSIYLGGGKNNADHFVHWYWFRIFRKEPRLSRFWTHVVRDPWNTAQTAFLETRLIGHELHTATSIYYFYGKTRFSLNKYQWHLLLWGYRGGETSFCFIQKYST